MATIVKVPVLTLPLKNTLVNMDADKTVSMGDKDKLIKEIFVDKLNMNEVIPINSQSRTINRLSDYKLLSGHVWQDSTTGRLWEANADIAKDTIPTAGLTGATVKPYKLADWEGINQSGSARGKLTDDAASFGKRYMKAIAGAVSPAAALGGRVWAELNNHNTPLPWAPCSTTVEGKGGWVAGAPPGGTGMIFTGGVGKEGTGWESIGLTALSTHTTARPYKAGELCIFQKNVYRANGDIGQGTAFNYNSWTFWTGTNPGTICAFGPTANTEGWWLCNGTTINAPGSLLHGTTAPNLVNYVVAGAGNEGSVGSVTGKTLHSMAHNEIPNVEVVAVSEIEDSTHYHSAGTMKTDEEADHQHPNSWYQYTWQSQRLDGGDDSTGTFSWPLMTTQWGAAGGRHDHNLVGKTAGQDTNHKHTVKVRINGNQSQVQMDRRQLTMYLNYYIKL